MPIGKKTCNHCGELTGARALHCQICGKVVESKKKGRPKAPRDVRIKSSETRTRVPDAGDGDFKELAMGFLKKIGVKGILKAIIQENKGLRISFGETYVKTVEKFVEYLAEHGYRLVKLPAQRSLRDSLEKAEREWREARVKYGLDEEEVEPTGDDETDLDALRKARNRRIKRSGLATLSGNHNNVGIDRTGQ